MSTLKPKPSAVGKSPVSPVAPHTRGLASSAATTLQSPGVKMTDSGETSGRAKFRLTLDTINPFVKDMQYAVRGRMPQEAAKIEAAIKKVSSVN